jgi:hypothetical protein
MNFKYLYSWVGDIHKKPQTRLTVWSFNINNLHPRIRYYLLYIEGLIISYT